MQQASLSLLPLTGRGYCQPMLRPTNLPLLQGASPKRERLRTNLLCFFFLNVTILFIG